VAIALVSVLLVIAVIAALYLAQARGGLTRQVAAVQARAGQTDRELAAAAAERDDLRDKVAWLDAANNRMADELERQRERGDQLGTLLDATTAEAESAPGAGAGASAAERPDDGGVWLLLLSHITRHWAAVVGVPPANRHLVPGPTSAQVTQAVTREAERLREEVGVDIELTVTAPVEPGERVAFLLAAVELMEALAASAERITVELDGRLALVGDGWLDVAGEVGAARDRAVAAGAKVELVEPGPEQVRIEVTA
jgi:hypothetical protein